MPRLPLLLAVGTFVVATALLPAQATAMPAAEPPRPVLTAPQRQEPAGAPKWQSTGLSGPVWTVFTPTSGALLARTPTLLARAVSDDPWNGGHWRSVPAPSHTLDTRYWSIVVDPTNHDILYASADGGLFKSADGGRTWTLILPTNEFALTVTISPANNQVVYAGLGRSDDGGRFRFLRSNDGGATWTLLEQYQNMTCFWNVPILLPHPTDEQQVFRSGGCWAGRDFYDQLLRSHDQGTSWTTVFGVGRPGVGSRDAQHPEFTFPTRLRGGQGSAPERFYLATRRDSRVGGGVTLFRSDDNAQTWTDIFASRPDAEPDGARLVIGGLAYDPARPDTVYLGVNVFAPPEGSSPPTFLRASMQVSADGGASWQPVGQQDLPQISHLAMGVDGRNLYAATASGLWRMSVPAQP